MDINNAIQQDGIMNNGQSKKHYKKCILSQFIKSRFRRLYLKINKIDSQRLFFEFNKPLLYSLGVIHVEKILKENLYSNYGKAKENKEIMMYDSRLKINKDALFIIILMLVFAFQRQLIELNNIFSYIDEVFFIMVTLKIFLCVLKRSKKISSGDIKTLGMMFGLFVIGLIGNLHSKVLQNYFQVFVDVTSIFKVFMAFYWVKSLDLKQKTCDQIIHTGAGIIRVLSLTMIICCLLSYAGFNLGMTGEIRYGIKSFLFTFYPAGNFSKYFYFAIPLLSADLYYSRKRTNYIFIGINLLIWLTTLRSRAFAFIACYLVFSYWFFRIRNQKKKKIDIVNILPFAFIATVISWEQIVFYLTSETQTRANLLRYSFITAKTYFPIGSGFGTYGSDVAVNNYSKLYTLYGFQNIYGMGSIHTAYLNDNYWPMIVGQFGLIGTFVVVYILYRIYKDCLKFTKQDKYFYFATICMTFVLLASSIASKSYSEFTSIAVFILHGVLMQNCMCFCEMESTNIEIDISGCCDGMLSKHK